MHAKPTPRPITFATTNAGKIESATRRLSKWGIEVRPVDLALPETRGTLEEIAEQKAGRAFRHLRKPAIAMDAGFFIPSLNGFPRQFTNFVLETIGLDGILTLVRGKDRAAEFREALAFCEHQTHRMFSGCLSGVLAEQPAGELKPFHWSELALIFIPEGFSKTLAEMDETEMATFRRQHDPLSPFEQFGPFWVEYSGTVSEPRR